VQNKRDKSDQIQPGNQLRPERSPGRPVGSKNIKKRFTKEQVLRDLEFVYLNSKRAGNWTNALTAKVWQGKFLGIARTRKLPDITNLSDMNAEQLNEFVEIMAEHDQVVRDSLKKGEES
jgi:hypothetical protein